MSIFFPIMVVKLDLGSSEINMIFLILLIFFTNLASGHFGEFLGFKIGKRSELQKSERRNSKRTSKKVQRIRTSKMSF